MSRSTYSAAAIQSLKREWPVSRQALKELQQRTATQTFRSDLGKEYGQHGFGRRVRTLSHCLDRVFELIPVDTKVVPSSADREDAEAFVHTSLMATYGAMDNLAWLWAGESGLKHTDGLALPRSFVGLRAKNKIIRASLPDEVACLLDKAEGWFAQLEDYRDALAHRIPPYIPPYSIAPESVDLARDLERRAWEALRKGDLDEHARLEREHEALKHFHSVIQHSWGEPARPAYFHWMLIVNAKTVVQLGTAIFDHI